MSSFWPELCVLALLGGLFACDSSSSATDYEQAKREMRMEVRHDRWRTANDQRRRANERRNARIDSLFYSRFEGQLQSGIGCDVCPDLCERVDLRPVAQAVFQAHFRKAVEAMNSQDDLESALGSRELRRLLCMFEIGGEPLVHALGGLMGPGESYHVRIEAALDGIIEMVLSERGYQVLREIASGNDDAARLAELQLEHLENGVYNYDSETW